MEILAGLIDLSSGYIRKPQIVIIDNIERPCCLDKENNKLKIFFTDNSDVFNSGDVQILLSIKEGDNYSEFLSNEGCNIAELSSAYKLAEFNLVKLTLKL